MNQKELNNFKRKYLDLTKRLQKNVIIHDANTTPSHRILVQNICEWLRYNNLPYYTRVYTNWGEIPDIVAPDLPRPIIEVRDSEKKKVKAYNPDYGHLRIFVDVDNPFKLR